MGKLLLVRTKDNFIRLEYEPKKNIFWINIDGEYEPPKKDLHNACIYFCACGEDFFYDLMDQFNTIQQIASKNLSKIS
ncbi:MAG: hypothetical protein ISS18_15655 [Bacteroidales bacterium]|nr:hypothetical protein [Bacteroidales bacterium]